MARLFKGVSSVGGKPHNWTLYDINLVNQDLWNHFNTRVGERVMRPDWGCEIWNYFMDPDSNRDLIVQEAVRICLADTRVQVVSVDVSDIDYGIVVNITLNYIPLGVVASFAVNFENRQNAYYNGIQSQ